MYFLVFLLKQIIEIILNSHIFNYLETYFHSFLSKLFYRLFQMVIWIILFVPPIETIYIGGMLSPCRISRNGFPL